VPAVAITTEPETAADAIPPRMSWVTRRRIAKWDRPRRPRDWRYWVGTVGKVLIATGLLLFGFVAYQLWGTGLETARAQRALAEEFDELLAALDTAPAPSPTTPPSAPPVTVPVTTPDSPPVTAPPVTAPPVTEPPAVVQPMPPISEGDPIARIEIPRIGVSDIVVAGVGVSDLQKGPGHFPDTPMPGQLGNSAIAGHRTTYGQPFRNVDQLEPGDEIVVTTLTGRFVYRVTGTRIVSPSDYQVVATTRPDVAEITLVSCHPVWSAAQRIIISGELDLAASPPPGAPTSYRDDPGAAGNDAPAGLPGEELPSEPTVPVTTPSSTPSSVPVASVPVTTVPMVTTPPVDDAAAGGVSTDIEDAFGRGWFHDEGAFAQVALWGLVLTLISVGAYLLSRRARRDLVGFAVGVVPFCLAAFFFFQNVNRLLPPSL
jgi:sortase A